ncbi:hypothetical protein R6Q59_021927 [Mikania micrantha]
MEAKITRNWPYASSYPQCGIFGIKARCDKVFNKRNTKPEYLMEDIKANAFNWMINRPKRNNLDWVEWCDFNFYSGV